MGTVADMSLEEKIAQLGNIINKQQADKPSDTAPAKAGVNMSKSMVPSTPSAPKADLASLMREALTNSTHLQAVASHPDFPALASDTGVQSLVAALTNQVGTVLQGIKGSGHNVVTTIGD